MMPRKRRQSADEAPLAPATAAATAKAQKQSGGGCDGGGGGGGPGGTGQEVMAKGWQLATMPKQPTAGYTASGRLLPGGRLNACWAPPVVAISKFYGFARLPPTSLSSRAWPAGAGGGGAGEITVESVLGLRCGDEDEEACEVLEDITGSWLVGKTYGNDEATIRSPAGVGRSNDVVWGGPTSKMVFGSAAVHEAWWGEVKRTLGEEGNLVLMLVERLEGGKDKGNTHYLLVLGYEETRRRRAAVRSLWLKDPMEGDTLLRAECWAEPEVELLTFQPGGRKLDRYAILESTHLRRPCRGDGGGGGVGGAAVAEVARSSTLSADEALHKGDQPAVFLDVDGVLLPISQEQRSSADPFAFPQRCLDALEYLLNQTGARVILSSTWRNSPSLQSALSTQFAKRGGSKLQAVAHHCCENAGTFPWTTEIGVHKPRHQEIAEYLHSGSPEAQLLKENGDQWVVLDDEELVQGCGNAEHASLFRPRAVKVNEKVGLTLDLAKQAVESLRRSRDQHVSGRVATAAAVAAVAVVERADGK